MRQDSSPTCPQPSGRAVITPCHAITTTHSQSFKRCGPSVTHTHSHTHSLSLPHHTTQNLRAPKERNLGKERLERNLGCWGRGSTVQYVQQRSRCEFKCASFGAKHSMRATARKALERIMDGAERIAGERNGRVPWAMTRLAGRHACP